MRCLAYKVSPLAVRVLQAAGWAEAGGLGPSDVDAWFAAGINYALHERHALKEAQKKNAGTGGSSDVSKRPGQGGVSFVGVVPTHRQLGG